MWKSTSRAFRICMARGGRESLRPTYSQPKLTLVLKKKNTPKGGVTGISTAKRKIFERNPPERIFEIVFRKSSQEDFAQRCLVWPKHFLLHRPWVKIFFLKQGSTSAGCNFALKTPYPPPCHTYSESSGRALSHGTTQYMSYLLKKLSKSRFREPRKQWFWGSEAQIT